jgi:hypothetical protein
MFFAFGGASVIERIEPLFHLEGDGLTFARSAFPVWVERGLPDYSLTLHSAGMSYWAALGHHLGFSGLAEFPAPQAEPFGHVGDDVRCDSTWFDRQTHCPVLLAEFERYEGKLDCPKLQAKVENLLLAHHRWQQSARYLVLAYWTKGLTDLPQHEELRHRFRTGLITRAMEDVPGSATGEILFFQFILREAPNGDWRLWQIRARGTA